MRVREATNALLTILEVARLSAAECTDEEHAENLRAFAEHVQDIHDSVVELAVSALAVGIASFADPDSVDEHIDEMLARLGFSADEVGELDEELNP